MNILLVAQAYVSSAASAGSLRRERLKKRTPERPMNVLMVTPHLPPHQAANALLPHLLVKACARGHGVRYLHVRAAHAREGVVCAPPARARAAIPQLLEATEDLVARAGAAARQRRGARTPAPG
jgi:hypothetical protein